VQVVERDLPQRVVDSGERTVQEAAGHAQQGRGGTEAHLGAEEFRVPGGRSLRRVREVHRMETVGTVDQEADHPMREGQDGVRGLPRRRTLGGPVAEADIAGTAFRVGHDREAQHRTVQEEELGRALQGSADGGRVLHGDGERAEDPDVLVLGDAQAEVRAGQDAGCALEKLGHGHVGHQDIVTVEGLDGHTVLRRERFGIAPELFDDLTETAHACGSDHGAHVVQG
jgi:hypothetical protein